MVPGAYGHRVSLKSYHYEGALQLQVDVGDDRVFFGWPLHAALRGAAPLYRGMVVQFDDRSPPPLARALAEAPASAACASASSSASASAASSSASAASASAASASAASASSAVPEPISHAAGAAGAAGAAPVRVLAIAKLKCLRYLVRTFGVRNLLSVLLEHGPSARLARCGTQTRDRRYRTRCAERSTVSRAHLEHT